MKKEARGGARVNAGRKKTKAESVSLTLNIEKNVAEAMRKYFKGNVSSLTENYYKSILKEMENNREIILI